MVALYNLAAQGLPERALAPVSLSISMSQAPSRQAVGCQAEGCRLVSPACDVPSFIDLGSQDSDYFKNKGHAMTTRLSLPQSMGKGWQMESLFELGGSNRLLAMEGLRGVAVGLVFFHHYCMQFIYLTDLYGPTLSVASALKIYGNYGVELFFVISGFLIYSMLLKRRPDFLSFMRRRAERIYPAFLVALAIGILLDPMRPVPKIPDTLPDAALYLGANVVFLPGLFPIDPLFSVNWSLSYEWWFYFVCTFLFGTLGLSYLPARIRVAGILAVGFALTAAKMAGVEHLPIRGLCLLAGMLLAEAHAAGIVKVPSRLALPAVIVAFCLLVSLSISPWLSALIQAIVFFMLASAAFNEGSAASNILCFKPLRWLGNISYSFYLMHGFVIICLASLILPYIESSQPLVLFWLGIIPTFAISVAVSVILFLFVEKPFSLNRS